MANKIQEKNITPNLDLSCLEFNNQKGSDNLFYDIKIINSKEKNSIIFQSLIKDDFAGINYSKEYTLKELYNFDYFKQFPSSEHIFKEFFIEFKNKELTILKKDNKIIVSFKFKANDKFKKIEFILDGDLNDIKDINNIRKLVDKITNINNLIYELNKNLEEQKNINEKNLKNINERLNNYNKIIENIIEKLNLLDNEDEEENNKNENLKETCKNLSQKYLNKSLKFNNEKPNKSDKCNEKEKLTNQGESIIFKIIEYIFKNKFILLFILFILYIINNKYNISKENKKIRDEVVSGYNNKFNDISIEII